MMLAPGGPRIRPAQARLATILGSTVFVMLLLGNHTVRSAAACVCLVRCAVVPLRAPTDAKSELPHCRACCSSPFAATVLLALLTLCALCLDRRFQKVLNASRHLSRSAVQICSNPSFRPRRCVLSHGPFARHLRTAGPPLQIPVHHVGAFHSDYLAGAQAPVLFPRWLLLIQPPGLAADRRSAQHSLRHERRCCHPL